MLPRFRRRLPLAWLLLTRQPARLITAFVGVAAAGILILMQFAFQDAMFRSSVSIVDKFDADLLLISSQSASLVGLAGFPEERLSSVLRSPDVQSVLPVRWHYVKWRLPGELQSRLAIAVGINPFQPIFNDPLISSQQHLLGAKDRVLYDSLSRPEFGPVKEQFEAGKKVVAYVGSHRLFVAGLVRFGPSFGYDSSFLTSIVTWNQLVPTSLGLTELGVVKLAPGSDPDLVARRLSPQLPEDVVVMTKSAFESYEKVYWAKSKPIGFVFSFCSLMGLAVGATMVYQLLHMDVTFHLPAYALLMSIGYQRQRLEMIVFTEGLILSCLGFPLAWLVGAFLCSLVVNYTSLPMILSPQMVVTTFLLILFMCSTSAMLAMGKIKDADPADLFQ